MISLERTDWMAIAPEIILLCTAMATLLSELGSARKKGEASTAAAFFGIGTALIWTVVFASRPSQEVFSRSMVIDSVSQYFKALLMVTGAGTVLLGGLSKEIKPDERAEHAAVVVLGTLSMCVMSSAVHFLLLFLAYQAAGIACIVLAGFKRRSPVSSEAGMKLYVYSMLTSVFFLLGVVLLFGVCRAFNILDIKLALSSVTTSGAYLWIAFGLLFTAVASRISAFPFHFLFPDVIEGAPTPASAFLSISSMISALAFGLRLFLTLFSAKGTDSWIPLPGFAWPTMIAGIAAVTMTLGNLTALYQTNIKRLLGYSCIAQVGYFLMGMVVLNLAGVAALLFSLATFTALMLGAFFVVQSVMDQAENEQIEILEGLVWKKPFEGAVLGFFLVSLAGLPPLVGFVGRFYLLGAVIHQKLYWLAIVATLNWVIGFSTYLVMVYKVFARTRASRPEAGSLQSSVVVRGAATAFLVPTLFLGLYWDFLMGYITRFLSALAW